MRSRTHRSSSHAREVIRVVERGGACYDQDVLEVRNVAKRYGELEALRGVSFTARAGEVLGLLGPNGAGKTTTLRIITGFIAPSAGQVLVCGQDIREAPSSLRARIGYLPESVPLYPEMRVGEYLSYRAALKGVPARLRGGRIAEAAEQVGVTSVLGRIIGQLSRGYRQRVGLCDALTHQPEVIILDEPTEGLDPNQRREVLELVERLGRERTVLLSTHVLPEAETLCDRVVILDRGQVAMSGVPRELGRVADQAILIIEARGDVTLLCQVLQAIDGVTAVETTPLGADLARFRLIATGDVREQAARGVVQAGAALRELRGDDSGLVAAFGRLRGGTPAPRSDSRPTAEP